MDYAATILLLIFYFIRPQDWVPGMAGFNVAKPIMLMGILGLMTRRRSKAASGPWPFLATPHEWVMVVYILYILATAFDIGFTVADLAPKVMGFFLALHSITSEKRLADFLKWWRRALIGVTVMGIGTIAGVDFTASQAATDANQGRLSLHHWMLDNANAYGHTLITLLPLLYFGMVRNKPFTRWLPAIPVALLCCICLWYTKSKGAYLVGAGLLVFCFYLGRSWWMKLSILALALGLGGTALSMLPRMNEMSSLRSDEGVVGRLMAWDMARNVTRTTATGEGYVGFHAVIKWEGRLIPKATHSAYVQVGGDLGIPGLLLYLSALCCGLRTMFSCFGVSREMDNLRGALFALLVGYMASGWMINRSYHLEFFLILGAIAAYQRLCWRELAAREPSALAAPAQGLAWKRKRLVRAAMGSALLRRIRGWRAYGLADAGVAFAALQLVLYIWDYVLVNL